MVWLDGPGTVSYTHLDVYKRQREDLECIEDGGKLPHADPSAVSRKALELSLIHI